MKYLFLTFKTLLSWSMQEFRKVRSYDHPFFFHQAILSLLQAVSDNFDEEEWRWMCVKGKTVKKSVVNLLGCKLKFWAAFFYL